jgi:short-subunit dehydrogenase
MGVGRSEIDAARLKLNVRPFESAAGKYGIANIVRGLPKCGANVDATHEPVDGSTFTVAPLKRLVDINLMGTAHCLAPVVEQFVARRAGRIAVVASMAGYRGLPTASAYGATKAALINMCEALRVELDRHGVILSVVTPGFVRTPLTDRNPFPMPFLMEPEDAARRIVRGLEGRRFEIAFPWRFAAIMKLLRLLPYPLFFAATRHLVPKDKSS